MAVKGKLSDMTFIELLQMMHQSRKTGRLEITTPDNRWAMIIFQEGTVWHVEPRGFRGASPVEVLYELISLDDGGFVFQRLQLLPSLERTISVSTESLIMEGTKRLDDQAAVAEETGEGKVDQIIRIRPGAEAKLRYVPQNVKRVVMAIDGQRTLAEVVQKSQLEPAQAAQIVKDLLSQEVLELIEIKDENAPETIPEESTTPG
ncbi:MAG: DUF4388 domain-containing protein [Armatimonadota bacterium]